MKAFRPGIYETCEKAVFEACPDESFDYAVMEHAQGVVVVPMNAYWNDAGGFAALWEVSEQDGSGNAFIGDVKSVDTKNSLVFDEGRLVRTMGVEGLVIVNTKDTVPVVNKDEFQKSKRNR